MKKITIVIPTFNEEENVSDIARDVFYQLSAIQTNYDINIMFIDNYSTDRTRNIILELAKKDSRIKAIFNAMNFGFVRSTFYGLTHAEGDAVILMAADRQDPPEYLLKFIEKWEEGSKVVIGIVQKSNENKLMFLMRKAYYKLIHRISDVEQIEHFNGFGLYSREFLEVLKDIKDSLPYLRGMVAELGFQRTEIYYKQAKRTKGKTHFNFFKLYDLAMLGITSYSKVLLRLSTMMGFVLSILSFGVGIYSLIMKLLYWDSFPMGTAAMVIGIFVLGSIQLFFIGLLGEYILNINTRLLNRPLVVEEKRINF